MQKKILLVDDEKIIRQALCRNLQKSGYEVMTAENGLEAIPLIQENSYDMIVTDYLMTGMNGVELMTEAKKICPGIKVIIFSGYVENSIEELLKEADSFLKKPLSLDDLLDTINALLN